MKGCGLVLFVGLALLTFDPADSSITNFQGRTFKRRYAANPVADGAEGVATVADRHAAVDVREVQKEHGKKGSIRSSSSEEPGHEMTHSHHTGLTGDKREVASRKARKISLSSSEEADHHRRSRGHHWGHKKWNMGGGQGGHHWGHKWKWGQWGKPKPEHDPSSSSESGEATAPNSGDKNLKGEVGGKPNGTVSGSGGGNGTAATRGGAGNGTAAVGSAGGGGSSGGAGNSTAAVGSAGGGGSSGGAGNGTAAVGSAGGGGSSGGAGNGTAAVDSAGGGGSSGGAGNGTAAVGSAGGGGSSGGAGNGTAAVDSAGGGGSSGGAGNGTTAVGSAGGGGEGGAPTQPNPVQ